MAMRGVHRSDGVPMTYERCCSVSLHVHWSHRVTFQLSSNLADSTIQPCSTWNITSRWNLHLSLHLKFHDFQDCPLSALINIDMKTWIASPQRCSLFHTMTTSCLHLAKLHDNPECSMWNITSRGHLHLSLHLWFHDVQTWISSSCIHLDMKIRISPPQCCSLWLPCLLHVCIWRIILMIQNVPRGTIPAKHIIWRNGCWSSQLRITFFSWCSWNRLEYQYWSLGFLESRYAIRNMAWRYANEKFHVEHLGKNPMH